MKTFVLLLLNIFITTAYSQEPFQLIKTKHVEIHLDSISYSSHQLKGFADITFEPKDSFITKVTFYLCLDTIDSVYINSTKYQHSVQSNCLYQVTCDTLRGGTNYHLKIWYHGTPTQDPQGFGGVLFSSNHVFNLGVSLNLIPHSFGRAWFPTTDHFQDKSTYSFFITTDTSQVAVCNGSLIETISHPGTPFQTWHWEMHDSIPAYLASFAIANYVHFDTTYQSLSGTQIPVHIYVPSSLLAKVPGTFLHLHDALQIFETLFGNYRWERIGYVGVPFNGGAMEHATNIALPLLVINGNTNYETVLFHELSHHWFGDLVTCKTPQEMWLNEGWARYCEYLFLENKYGLNSAQSLYVDVLANTLEKAHVDDGDFYPVGNVPLSVTYGTTVYDKGLLVVHTLRHYMGDSLFFPAVRHYLDKFAFKNASNEDFRVALEESSNLNLSDFFQGWVLTKGFPHFDISYFTSTPLGNNQYEVKVIMHQKLYGADNYWNSNKVELVFGDSLSHQQTLIAHFSGKFDTLQFTLPFNPQYIWLDPTDKVADACVGQTLNITTTGIFTVNKAYAWYKVSQLQSPYQVRIEHHVAAPDTGTFADTIYRISPNHYWKVSGYIPQGTTDTLQFQYIRSKEFNDKFLLTASNSADSLVLLYRKDANDAWRIIPFKKTGNQNIGKLITPFVENGEYAFAIGKPNLSLVQEKDHARVFQIYPNPGHKFLIESSFHEVDKMVIVDNAGKTVDVIMHPTFPYTYQPSLPEGTYRIVLLRNNQMLKSSTFVILKD